MFLLPCLHDTEHGAVEHQPVANPDDSSSFLPPPPSPAWLATPHFPQLGLRWNVIIMPRSEAHTVSHTASGQQPETDGGDPGVPQPLTRRQHRKQNLDRSWNRKIS